MGYVPSGSCEKIDFSFPSDFQFKKYAPGSLFKRLLEHWCTFSYQKQDLNKSVSWFFLHLPVTGIPANASAATLLHHR